VRSSTDLLVICQSTTNFENDECDVESQDRSEQKLYMRETACLTLRVLVACLASPYTSPH